MIYEITKDNFEAEVVNSDKPVLIDFWAEWCGPCRLMAPHVDAIAEEREDIKVGKIDVDKESPLCAHFGIDSIPTLIIFKNGEAAGKLVGLNSKAFVLGFIDKTI